MNTEIFCSNMKRMEKLGEQLVLAQQQLKSFMPLDESSFDPDKMDAAHSLFLDGFRARFSDLQDMLGKIMFKSIAQLDQDESPENELSTRERIVLMEKRGILSVNKWQDTREIRNSFAHDYPDNHAKKARNYNAVWNYSQYLLDVIANIQHYIAKKYGTQLCG